mgnify:CR=1 FL=1
MKTGKRKFVWFSLLAVVALILSACSGSSKEPTPTPIDPNLIAAQAEGRVVEADVVRPSNSRVLDRRAMAIVRASAPFGAFSAEMRRQTDQIVVTSRFRFTREEGLETTLSQSVR